MKYTSIDRLIEKECYKSKYKVITEYEVRYIENHLKNDNKSDLDVLHILDYILFDLHYNRRNKKYRSLPN